MAINFKEVFGKVLKVGGEVLKQVAVQEASKIPAVQKEIEKQKTVVGKNILWTVFPILLAGGLILFLFRGR